MSMSKHSTNKKSNTPKSESAIPTSNRFDVLSSKGKTNRAKPKNQSNKKATTGFDNPNWRSPVNKVQELYTRTPRPDSSQLQRRRLYISNSVTDLNLVHCNSRVPISGHWKLPNNTYEKQAYLHWAKENSLAFKRKEPQIPYDPWQYIRRIKSDAKKREQQAFEKEAWALFQEAKLEWIKANPKLALPDWLADYDQAGWIKEVNKRAREAQKKDKKQLQKEKKQQRQSVTFSEDQEQGQESEADPETLTEQPNKVLPKKGSPRKFSNKKREIVQQNIAKRFEAKPTLEADSSVLPEIVVTEEAETKTSEAEPSDKSSEAPTHEFFVFTVPTREPLETLDRLTDELCKFQVEANIIADQYRDTPSESQDKWTDLLERLHQWVDSNSPNKENLHQNVLALFAKIVKNVQERQIFEPGHFEAASAIPLYIYQDQLEATRKQRARLLWCLEVTNFIVAKTPVDQIPDRVLNYHEESYLEIAKKREDLARRYYFGGKSIQPASGCTLPPLSEIPPPLPHSSLGLWMLHQYQVDEALRRAVDPTGKPLDIKDEGFLLRRLREEAAGLDLYRTVGISPPEKRGEQPVWPPVELQSVASQDSLPVHQILTNFIAKLPQFVVVCQAQLFDQLNSENEKGVDEGFVDDWETYIDNLQHFIGFSQESHWDNPRNCCSSWKQHCETIASGEHPSDKVTEATPPLPESTTTKAVPTEPAEQKLPIKKLPQLVIVHPPNNLPDINSEVEIETLKQWSEPIAEEKQPFNYIAIINEIDRIASEGIDDLWERALASATVIAGTLNVPHEHGPNKCDCPQIEDFVQQYQTYKARLAARGLEESDSLRWDRTTHLIQLKKRFLEEAASRFGDFNAVVEPLQTLLEESRDETGAKLDTPAPAAAI